MIHPWGAYMPKEAIGKPLRLVDLLAKYTRLGILPSDWWLERMRLMWSSWRRARCFSCASPT